ncbi:hypothetical protein HN789_04505 [archaeon]|jgi:hypothetical protein|nr:hypothetical protein [archaeon]MBT4022469.1 hypothetical protein [archaeon]MBT4272624.1 hypothetical protein [archaeon]MBT4461210.1 hypothetical protein [archaeon]MBT4858276.1 hypothetical protein [archaeon]
MKLQKIQSKKAQLETMQTVFIVLFLFISLFFVLVVVVAKDKANARTQIEQLVLLTEYKKAQIMDYLPELRCSFENVILKDCYDKLAIDSFANTVSKNQLYYNQLFGHAKITINEYETDWQTTEIYNNVPEDLTSTQTFFNPVIVYNALEAKKNFGVIEIEIYS